MPKPQARKSDDSHGGTWLRKLSGTNPANQSPTRGGWILVCPARLFNPDQPDLAPARSDIGEAEFPLRLASCSVVLMCCETAVMRRIAALTLAARFRAFWPGQGDMSGTFGRGGGPGPWRTGGV